MSKIDEGSFITKLQIENATDFDDGKYRLLGELAYYSKITGNIYIVPIGFISDLNSTPTFPLVYWLGGGRAARPAALHDYLYASKIVTRKMADAIFHESMGVVKTSGWRRPFMWAAVRFGGGSHYGDAVTEPDVTTD